MTEQQKKEILTTWTTLMRQSRSEGEYMMWANRIHTLSNTPANKVKDTTKI